MTAGLSLHTIHKHEDSGTAIVAEEPLVIFVDACKEDLYQAFERSIQESIGMFSERINPNNIHFISSRQLEHLPYLVQSPLFGHFIMRNYLNTKESGEHYGYVVRATLLERAFGIKNMMSPKAKVQVVKLSEASQKRDAVEAVKNYLLAAKFQSRMATVVANAVDELLMNAIFDAPVDELGRPLYNTTPRSAQMKLGGRQVVEMHLAYDGKYVAITAVDLFGSLDKMSVLSYVSKSYSTSEYKVRTSVANAGIGLATVFKSGGSFLFASESRTRTEVTVFFRRLDNYRKFKDQFRFLSTQMYF